MMTEEYAINILGLIKFIQSHPNQCDIIVDEIQSISAELMQQQYSDV